MPIATAKRSLENIPPISQPYFISGNFWSAASCPRILTLCKVKSGNFGHKGSIWGWGGGRIYMFFKRAL